ncbi:hypothetical protein QYF61_015366 [Mycteria americana]|uniref:Uncharacterized protein n=1 Tax=Mycteria americana TaxID=33587 RepID=A0AAN7N6L6_MYCAM|nr:hypothetical protein QYF61_015366 [Mycteria americana]
MHTDYKRCARTPDLLATFGATESVLRRLRQEEPINANSLILSNIQFIMSKCLSLKQVRQHSLQGKEQKSCNLGHALPSTTEDFIRLFKEGFIQLFLSVRRDRMQKEEIQCRKDAPKERERCQTKQMREDQREELFFIPDKESLQLSSVANSTDYQKRGITYSTDRKLALPSPPLNHVPKHHIYTPFKYLQGWRLNHFPGQPVRMLDNPFGE